MWIRLIRLPGLVKVRDLRAIVDSLYDISFSRSFRLPCLQINVCEANDSELTTLIFASLFWNPLDVAWESITVQTRSPDHLGMEVPLFTYVQVQVVDHGAVAIIKYNRPSSGNSLHPVLVQEMLAALRWADNDPQVRIIIQTGVGKFFCTGMHMDISGGDSPKKMSFAIGSDFHQLNKVLITTTKILIAAVNGPAAGYGVSSLALFDLVISVDNAYFFTPFVRWGMAAEGASSFSFPRLMGHQKAAGLFLAGERVSAAEAERIGLVTKILPAKGFLEEVLHIASHMAAAPPGSLKATKELMKAPMRQAFLDANDRECELIHKERYGFEEYTEAVQQFRVEQESKRKVRVKL